MLGRLRMDIDECEIAYRGFMNKIFNKHNHGNVGQWVDGAIETVAHGSKYGGNDLEEAIKDIVRKKLPKEGENALLFDSQVIPEGETQCKV